MYLLKILIQVFYMIFQSLMGPRKSKFDVVNGTTHLELKNNIKPSNFFLIDDITIIGQNNLKEPKALKIQNKRMKQNGV